MLTLVKTALVGTARHSEMPLERSDVENLVASLQTISREDQLLLRAGAQSLYEQAGQRAKTDVPVLPPASSSGNVLRSPRLSQLLSEVIRANRHDLLIEFLAALKNRRMELPYEVLPLALAMTDTAVRQHLQPVLGERGRWLSTMNPKWEWVGTGVTAVSHDDRAALKRAWEEGKLSQRILALSVMRGADAAEARRWLEETLSQEKADARAELVRQLEHGLSGDDEPLLEQLLDDRSDRVRLIAAAFLQQIPGSQLIHRMAQRSTGMLRWTGGKLAAHPPEEVPSEWQRDGVSSKVPQGKGKRAHWLTSILATIPLEHWTTQFNRQPEELLAAIAHDPFEQDVISGWTQAIEHAREDNAARLSWVHALWNYWLANWQQDKKKNEETLSRLVILLKLFPSATGEKNVLPFLVLGRLELDALNQLLNALPRPWSNAFSAQYLHLAREIVQSGVLDQAYEWGKTLEVAACALPREALATALSPWSVERTGQKSWNANALAQLVERFCDMVRLRQIFFEELNKEGK